jgi:hypothetical protein
MPNDEQTAQALLASIRQHLTTVFPNADISDFVDPRANDYGFRVRVGQDTRVVAGTETFFEADDGLEAAQSHLEALSERLGHLKPGQLLLIRSDGFEVIPCPTPTD